MAALSINRGTISGGLSGFGKGTAAGGTGIYLNGGTLINAGTIAGGAGGLGYSKVGDAVRFGTAAATLIVDPGAVFTGLVAGNSSNDTLVLGSAATTGTLSHLGTQFTGLTRIVENAGARWLSTAPTRSTRAPS